MTTTSKDLLDKWNAKNSLDTKVGDGVAPAYPNEYMVRVFASEYFSKLAGRSLRRTQKVLDVGTGFANHLRYFLDRGLDAVAVDVNDEMCAGAKKNLERFGYSQIPVLVGTSDKLPVGDGEFDILLSMRSLHYQPDAAAIRRALKEFHRVLKPGGLVFIQTTGPDDEFRASAKRKGELCWHVEDYNFRSGFDHGFFDDEDHIGRVCREFFESVETGRLTEKYPDSKMDHLIAICRKG
jgi:SAM-dependent methyltransferase